MKIFQIVNNFCFYDMKGIVSSLEETKEMFSPDTLFVEAPDYVFVDWGYNPDETGDARFIKPIPPEGWLYDDETGTFYPEESVPPSERPSYNELLSMFEAIEKGMTE